MFIGKEGVFFSKKIYRDHINMFLSELGYSELVQRLFEKMTFFLLDPLLLGDAEVGHVDCHETIVEDVSFFTTIEVDLWWGGG